MDENRPLLEQLDQISKIVSAVNELLTRQVIYLVVEMPHDPEAV